MEHTFLIRQLALTKLSCRDEIDALRLTAKLSRETAEWLRANDIKSWHQLLHSSRGELLDRGLWASSVHELDMVLARVGWSLGMPEAEIIRQLNLTILPTDIVLNSPSPSR